MGVLPFGNPTALLPTKCPAYLGRVAGESGRDIRADTEENQETKPRTCPSIVAMSCGGGSPTSSRGTCGCFGL